MKGKLIALALAASTVLTCATAYAGGHLQERDMIEVIRQQVAANREALVAENLNLTEEESENFWPVYRRFQNERAVLVDRRIETLTQFRDNFETLDDATAKQLLSDALKLEDDKLKLREKFLKDFRKVLSDKKVLRYLQIENKIDTIIDYDLAQVVPLAE
jgi:hypothetical protein